MNKSLFSAITLCLFTSCTMWTSGSVISTDFIDMGVPSKSYCLEKCEKYGQFNTGKPSVIVDGKEYADPWCFCMELCLKLKEPYCEADSTHSK